MRRPGRRWSDGSSIRRRTARRRRGRNCPAAPGRCPPSRSAGTSRSLPASGDGGGSRSAGAGQGRGLDATHIRPKWRLTATSVMVARKNSRQPVKTASGKLAKGNSSSSVVADFPAGSRGPVADGVDGGGQEEHAGDAQEQAATPRRRPSSRRPRAAVADPAGGHAAPRGAAAASSSNARRGQFGRSSQREQRRQATESATSAQIIAS